MKARLQKRYSRKGPRRVVGIAAVFYDPNRRPKEKYKSLNTTSETVARRKLAKLESEFLKGWDPWSDELPRRNTTVPRAIDSFIEARQDRSEKTRRADRSTLELLAETLPPQMPVSLIERSHIERFLGARDSASTKRTYLARINTFLKWCVGMGYCRSNVADEIPRPKVYRREKPYLKREEVERLIRHIESDAVLKSSSLKDGEVQWLADIIRLAVGTGMRLGELCALKWSAVDLTNRLLRIRVTKEFRTKSGNERTIPIRGEALRTLQRLSEQRTSEADAPVFESRRGRAGDRRSLNPGYVSKRFLKYAREAKMPEGTSFHVLRHTYLSWLAMDGAPMPVIKELAGHADIKTTMGYAHLSPESLSKAVEHLFEAHALQEQ